jgi:hypothetical protein
MNPWAKCAVVIGEMYVSLQPRLGILHFTLAIVFFPFGAPQAQSVPTGVGSALSVPARSVAPPAAAPRPREIGDCIARYR